MKSSAKPGMRGGLAAWVVLAALAVGGAGSAWAAIDCQPGTNVLNSVANVLSAEYGNLEGVLWPSGPTQPAGPWLVNRLDMMARSSANEAEAIDPLRTDIDPQDPFYSPDPWDPWDPSDPCGSPGFFEALGNVRAGAEAIAQLARWGLANPPYPYLPPEFFQALGGVEDAAWVIVNIVDAYYTDGEPGADPLLWLPGTNVLGSSVVNVLAAMDQNLEAVLYPPDPGMPPDPCLTCRLNAITGVGQVQGDRVQAVLSAQPPPDDGTPPEFLAALANVRSGAAAIADRARWGLTHPPEPGLPPEFFQALLGVEDAAQAIVNRVDAYLGPMDVPEGGS